MTSVIIGSNWNSAISTAQWKGARLRDILLAAGVREEDMYGDSAGSGKIEHVHFLGADNMQVSASDMICLLCAPILFRSYGHDSSSNSA